MSDNLLRLIPTDPTFVPTEPAREAALERVRATLQRADEVTFDMTEEVAFVDAGANFESIACPLCHAALDDGWWMEAMDQAHGNGFTDLGVSVPCCTGPTSLNDLAYDWPQGFARFVLEATNPDIPTVPDALLAELEEILGCKLRVIWARY